MEKDLTISKSVFALIAKAERLIAFWVYHLFEVWNSLLEPDCIDWELENSKNDRLIWNDLALNGSGKDLDAWL